MKAVDELETERDQQRNKQQQVRQERRGLSAAVVDVGVKAVGNEQERGPDDSKECDDAHNIVGPIQFGAAGGGGGTNRHVRGKIGHNYLPNVDNRSLCKEPRYVAGV